MKMSRILRDFGQGGAPTLEPRPATLLFETPSAPRRASPRSGIAIALVLGLGLTLSLAGSFALRGQLKAEAARDFELRARAKAGELQNGFLDCVEVVVGFATFVSLTEIDADRFHLYARTAYARHPELFALGWLPRVAASERKSFEAVSPAGLEPGFRIVEPSVAGDVAGDLVEAPERPQYFPVLYSERRITGPQRIGWDMGSDPERGTALRRAIEPGEVASTHPTRIPGVTGPKAGLVLFAPVYNATVPPQGRVARRAAAKGVVAGTVILADAVESSLSPSGTDSAVDLYLYEGSVTDDEHLLYFRPSSDSAGGAVRASLRGADVTAGTYRTFPLDLADANFTVLVRPAPGFGPRTETYLPSAVLLAGFAITAFLARHLYATRAEAISLQTNASYVRSLMEASLDPFITISPEGKIVDANEATIQATGVPHAALVGADFAAYFTDPEKAHRGYREAFAKGFVTDHPLALRHVSGRVRDILLNVSVYRGAGGKIAGLFATARDITERKRAEDELARYREHLEELVAVRTADLAKANALLEAGNKELEASNKELEAFSYSVSHDLRTPLRAIDGFSRILLEDHAETLDAEGRRVLNVVRDNTKKMSQLIDDILAFSRTGRQEMGVGEVDMERLVREAIEELEPASAGRDIAFEIAPLPAVNGDRAMLRRVFVNLIDNAVKFTATKPKADIEVGARRDGHECVFSVEDNGVGFDMQYVGKLFGVFQRLNGAGEFSGTGIGLAIVKRIVSRHGGRVWAEGKLGEGAIFYFTLPITEKSDA